MTHERLWAPWRLAYIRRDEKGDEQHPTDREADWLSGADRECFICRAAAESLGKIQTEFLDSLTIEINDNVDSLMDGEFMLNEFVDRFGPRMAHLNGLLQVLSQLSAMPDQANTPNSL